MDEELYRAYLLRLRRVAGGWRPSLEDAHSGVRRGFPDLAALLRFLEAQLPAPRPEDDNRDLTTIGDL